MGRAQSTDESANVNSECLSPLNSISLSASSPQITTSFMERDRIVRLAVIIYGFDMKARVLTGGMPASELAGRFNRESL